MDATDTTSWERLHSQSQEDMMKGKMDVHIMTVQAGEDVGLKVLDFYRQGYNDVCVISAQGLISKVGLRRGLEGTTVDYEGRFRLISLSGFYHQRKDSNGVTGGLTMCFENSDNVVLGGSVSGVLVAASPVQIVLCSYFAQEIGNSSGDCSIDDCSIDDANNHDLSLVDNDLNVEDVDNDDFSREESNSFMDNLSYDVMSEYDNDDSCLIIYACR